MSLYKIPYISIGSGVLLIFEDLEAKLVNDPSHNSLLSLQVGLQSLALNAIFLYSFAFTFKIFRLFDDLQFPKFYLISSTFKFKCVLALLQEVFVLHVLDNKVLISELEVQLADLGGELQLIRLFQ